MRDHQDRPNIVLINCDDLGYGDLGCYGAPTHATPWLDALAAQGMRFTDFYQASSLCSPSRGAMLTGCYPKRIGFDRFSEKPNAWVLFPGQGVGLNPSEVTFASLLKGRGYATCCIGKWHCGDQPEFLPTRHGFDHYYGLPYSNDMGRQVRREKTPPLPLMRDEEVIEAQPDQTGLTERYVEEAVRFIRANKDEPFLLYFAQMYVHLPLYVQDRFLKESKNGKYGAAVACIDWSVGVLMHELKRLGLDRNTLILFTSDNGSKCQYGPSNGPLQGIKGSSWEGGFRLPLIAWWPGVIPAGATSQEMVTGMDLLPTFARLSGAALPADRILDGRDISPLLRGEPEARSPHQAFFYYFGDHLDAVRCGRWKLFVGRHSWGKQATGLCELYDLETDVGETTNVADAHAEVVCHLQELLDNCRRDLGDATTGTAGANIRPRGLVANAKPLTTYDENHPYIISLYDLDEVG